MQNQSELVWLPIARLVSCNRRRLLLYIGPRFVEDFEETRRHLLAKTLLAAQLREANRILRSAIWPQRRIMGDELWLRGRLASSLLAYLSIGVFNYAQGKVGDADLAAFAAAA